MAVADCKKAIEDALGRRITHDELEAFATEFQARMKAKLDAGVVKGAAARTVAEEMSADAKYQAAKAKWRAYDNLVKKTALRDRGADTSAELSTVSPEMLSTRKNAATTIGTIHDSLFRQLAVPMQRAIDKLGLRSIHLSRDPAQQLRIEKEIWRAGGDTTVAATGDKNAEALAKIYMDAFEGSRAMQNKEGADIGKREIYTGRQIWDMLRTRGATFEKWRETFGPEHRIDSDFEGLSPEQVTSQLRSEYGAIRSGLFSNPVTTEGAFNIASKVSQERTINFKTPEDAVNARNLYGKQRSIGEAVVAQADAGAKNAALMQIFGSTPEKMAKEWHAENIAKAFAKQTPAGDALAEKLQKNAFMSNFHLATGLYDEPGNHTLASLSANWRVMQEVMKLGQLFFGGQALVHTGLMAQTMSRTDTSFMANFARTLRAVFPMSAVGREQAAMVGAGMDSLFHGTIRQFHEGGAGNLSALANLSYKLNGFGPFMDRMKAAGAVGLTHGLGLSAGKTLDKLSPNFQNDLLRYGIEAKDWDAARAVAGKSLDGRVHLIPSDIEDAAVRAKFQNYIAGEIASGANEPTVWARNAANAHTQAGTWSGEFFRTLTQFMSFPITMMQRQWGQQFRGGVNVPGILQLASMGLGFGLLHIELSGLLNNQQQQIPTDTAGWLGLMGKAAVGGGTLGLLADGFLRDSAKTAPDAAKSVLGPTFGGIGADTLAAMNVPGFVAAGESAHGGVGQHMLQMLKNIGADVTPNIAITSAAYNYLAPYMIANWLHPGAIQRHERVMQKNNQQWIVPPR